MLRRSRRPNPGVPPGSPPGGTALAAPPSGGGIDYDAIFRRNVDRVYRICLSVLGGDDDAAADATAAVWEKVVRRRPDDDVRDLDAWLSRVARTTAIDHLRALRRHADRRVAWDDEEFAVEDPDPTPEDLVLDDEMRHVLREQVALLSPAQRQVIELRLDGLTNDEIATLLGRSRNAIDQAAFKAIQRLRAAMRSKLGPEGGRA